MDEGVNKKRQKPERLELPKRKPRPRRSGSARLDLNLEKRSLPLRRTGMETTPSTFGKERKLSAQLGCEDKSDPSSGPKLALNFDYVPPAKKESEKEPIPEAAQPLWGESKATVGADKGAVASEFVISEAKPDLRSAKDAQDGLGVSAPRWNEAKTELQAVSGGEVEVKEAAAEGGVAVTEAEAERAEPGLLSGRAVVVLSCLLILAAAILWLQGWKHEEVSRSEVTSQSVALSELEPPTPSPAKEDSALVKSTIPEDDTRELQTGGEESNSKSGEQTKSPGGEPQSVSEVPAQAQQVTRSKVERDRNVPVNDDGVVQEEEEDTKSSAVSGLPLIPPPVKKAGDGTFDDSKNGDVVVEKKMVADAPSGTIDEQDNTTQTSALEDNTSQEEEVLEQPPDPVALSKEDIVSDKGKRDSLERRKPSATAHDSGELPIAPLPSKGDKSSSLREDRSKADGGDTKVTPHPAVSMGLQVKVKKVPDWARVVLYQADNGGEKNALRYEYTGGGEAVLSPEKPGRYVLKVTAPGYKPFIKPIQVSGEHNLIVYLETKPKAASSPSSVIPRRTQTVFRRPRHRSRRIRVTPPGGYKISEPDF